MTQRPQLSSFSNFVNQPSMDQPSNVSYFEVAKSKYLENIKPWPDFIKVSDFSLPKTAPEISRRLTENVPYYAANYAILVGGLLLFGIISSPVSAITLIVVGSAWLYLLMFRDAPLVIASRVVSDREKVSPPPPALIRLPRAPPPRLTLAAAPRQVLYLTVVSVVVLLVTGAHSMIFWVTGTSAVFIVLHAAMKNQRSAADDPEVGTAGYVTRDAAAASA
eukprot:tig00020828_g14363.t1